MNDLEQINFLGSLDQDNDPLYVKDINYTDALNVRSITTDTESSNSIINILGNKKICSIGSVPTQNKIYQIFINSVANEPLTTRYKIYDQNSSLIASISFPNISGSLTTFFNGTIRPAFITALSSAIPAQTFTLQLVTSDDVFGYMLFTLTTVAGRDYRVTNNNGSSDFILVRQDAFDSSVANELDVIGSYDLLGDLFVFSTSQYNEKSTIFPTISSITNGTPAVVNTTINHNLVPGIQISISGAINNNYNGNWIVQSTPTVNSFTLAGTSGLGTSGNGGNISINTYGVGEIGVITYNENSDLFTYTRLVRSRQLNFIRKKQIDCYVEKNSDKISVYFTDDYNTPRVLYYYGQYIQDGFLTVFNPDQSFSLASPGKYDLSTIGIESKLSVNQTPTTFTFLTQNQSGGGIRSGNWRYCYRFITDSGSSTEWSLLSNPIPVFTPSANIADKSAYGDDPDTPTSKSNSFSISGISQGLFKFIELAGVQYLSSNSQVGYIIKRVQIGGGGIGGSSTSIIHTGFEQYENLDLGTLNDASINYNTAKNLLAIDNRLVLSNLTVSQEQDFTAFATTIQHSIKREIIPHQGFYPNYGNGEYLNPSNVYSKLGYMHNEVYRFGLKLRLKDGSTTKVFWIDDIKIDTSSVNITSPNRRISGLTNYDINFSSETYSAYVEFSNIDLTYNIGGQLLRDIVDEIIIMRADCVPEILCTGIGVLTVWKDVNSFQNIGSLSTKNLYYNNYVQNPGIFYKGEFPFTETIRANDGALVNYPGNGNPDRTIFSFYSPDVIYGNTSIVYQSGDKVFNYGNPNTGTTTILNTSPAKYYSSTFEQYNGNNGLTSVSPINVGDVKFFPAGSESNFDGQGYSKLLKTYASDPSVGSPTQPLESSWFNLGSNVIKTTAPLNNVSPYGDFGTYYIQYYRPITYSNPDDNKYGNRSSTQYIPTGFKYIITPSSPPLIGVNTISVFGGDTFTQLSFLKRRLPNSETRAGGFAALGFGGGFAYYSQNRVNAQLNKKNNQPGGLWSYPDKPVLDWLLIDSSFSNEQPVYNSGYNAVNNINSDIAFDTSNQQTLDYPVRIIYSDLKNQNGNVDNYRSFLPLNFKDLDLSFGELIHMANGNGELVTWQPRKFQRQYFNTRGVLETEANLNVLIGDGSVLSRDGQTLTTIGSKHKWGIVKGRSAQGNDVFYWINTELKKVVRFGYDGTISLADIRGMQSYFANNLSFVDNKDNPSDGQGIVGVWDDRYMEAVFTVRGKRSIAQWNPGSFYSQGATVSFSPTNFLNFEKTGEIYKSLINLNNNNNPELSPSSWEIIPHTDFNYYSEFTIAYNESRNGFSSFYTPLPKNYLKWKDTYMSSRPVGKFGDIYIHNDGNYCQWYDNEEIQDGYIECVVNKNPSEVKWFSALRANSEIIPYRYDFKTFSHISFLTQSEITGREGNYDAPIKRDSSVTGINDGDTTGLFGKYLKVKMAFRNNVYQKLYSIITKFRISPRFSNK